MFFFFLGGLKNDQLFLNRKGEAQDHMVSYKQREDECSPPFSQAIF